MSNVNMSQEIEVEEMFNDEAERFFAELRMEATLEEINAESWRDGDDDRSVEELQDEFDALGDDDSPMRDEDGMGEDGFPMRDEYDDDEMMDDQRAAYERVKHEWEGV